MREEVNGAVPAVHVVAPVAVMSVHRSNDTTSYAPSTETGAPSAAMSVRRTINDVPITTNVRIVLHACY